MILRCDHPTAKNTWCPNPEAGRGLLQALRAERAMNLDISSQFPLHSHHTTPSLPQISRSQMITDQVRVGHLDVFSGLISEWLFPAALRRRLIQTKDPQGTPAASRLVRVSGCLVPLGWILLWAAGCPVRTAESFGGQQCQLTWLLRLMIMPPVWMCVGHRLISDWVISTADWCLSYAKIS